MSGEPYIAAEDSRLLRDALLGTAGRVFVEIGTGNAGALVEAGARFEVAAGTDLVRPAMADWRESRASVVIADAASCFRDGCADVVAFNPPYLRGIGDIAVEGGDGLEVPLRFLKDALRIVNDCGSIFFLLNDDAELGRFESECSGRGFEIRVRARRRVFFEELLVLECLKSSG